MTKYEFINGLKAALENELDNNKVLENVNYYNDYIDSEIRNGRSESDVIAELGDPWAIAKTIIDSESSGSNNYEEYSYTSTEDEVSRRGGYDNSYDRASGGPKVHIFGLDSWWKKLLLILGVIGVIMIVFSIVTGIISLIAPFIVPLIIISFVLKILKKRK